MCCVDEEPSGIMVSISGAAGTCIGTVAATGKKVAGFFSGSVTAAGRFLTRPFETPEQIADEQAESTSGGFGIGAKDEQETEQKKPAKSLIGALESELAAARDQLKQMQSKAEETRSEISSQLSELRSEKEFLLTALEQARSQANEVAAHVSGAKAQAGGSEILQTNLAAVHNNPDKSRKEGPGIKAQPSSALSFVQTEHALPTPLEEVVVVSAEDESGPSTEAATARYDEKVIVISEEQSPQVLSKGRAPTISAVGDKEVGAAVFENETERIIFRRALSDIANQDPAVRVDAVKAIAGISHELSVRVLVNQTASEASARVREECIKALTTLQTTEGLRSVEQALGDRSALVRLAAVWGLYRSVGAQSGPALVRMFSDKDAEIRRRAVTCIGWLGQEQLAVELLPLLDDVSVSVRLAAVEAMGTLNCRGGVTALIERLNDPEKAVRKAVLGALTTITGKKMSGPFPRDNRSLQRLIGRWREWWKEEQSG